MRQVEVEGAAGKPLKITCLSDWDLMFCLPYALFSFLYRLARGLVLAIVRAPIDLTYILFRRSGVSFIACMVLLPGLIAAASWVSTVAGAFSAADFASALAIFLLATMLLVKLNSEDRHLQDSTGRLSPVNPPSAREAAAFARIKREAGNLPDACVRHRYDKAILYLGWLRTMLLLPAFVCELALPASWLRYALLLCVLMFGLTDFEMIEHVRSHAAHGKLLVAREAPWWATIAELVRSYVVWPLFGWFPNCYYITHALHHHVENNGPADWQSTVRFDRASFLDFTKAVTWYGLINLIPVETFSYLLQRRGLRFARLLLRGWCWYALLLLAVALVQPLLAALLIAQRAFAGIGGYMFVGLWHGFHDPTQPSDASASNQALVHYAHHVNPRVHLLDGEGLKHIIDAIREPSPLLLLRSEFATPPGFWHLQGLLWKKDYSRAAQSLVLHGTLTENDRTNAFTLRPGLTAPGIDVATMRRVTAAFYSCVRPRWLRDLDASMSEVLGTLVHRRHRSSVPMSVAPAEDRT